MIVGAKIRKNNYIIKKKTAKNTAFITFLCSFVAKIMRFLSQS